MDARGFDLQALVGLHQISGHLSRGGAGKVYDKNAILTAVFAIQAGGFRKIQFTLRDYSVR